MAIGPIPFSAMMDYTLRTGMDREQAEEFYWIIQQLDFRYMDWSAKRVKSSAVQQTDGPKRGFDRG